MPRQPIHRCLNCNKQIHQLKDGGRTRKYCDAACRYQMFVRKQEAKKLAEVQS